MDVVQSFKQQAHRRTHIQSAWYGEHVHDHCLIRVLATSRNHSISKSSKHHIVFVQYRRPRGVLAIARYVLHYESVLLSISGSLPSESRGHSSTHQANRNGRMSLPFNDAEGLLVARRTTRVHSITLREHRIEGLKGCSMSDRDL